MGEKLCKDYDKECGVYCGDFGDIGVEFVGYGGCGYVVFIVVILI